jgi:hypothetical protein
MQSRRQFLATTVAVLGLAGCTGDTGAERAERYTDLAAGTPERPTFVDGYRFQLLRETGFEDFRTVDEILGIDPGTLEDMVGVTFGAGDQSEDQYWILQGSFEREAVESALDVSRQTGQYGGFDTFESESSVYGVADGTVVVATDRTRYEQAVDQLRGEIQSLVETDSEFETLARTLGAVDWVTVSVAETPPEFPGDPLITGRGAVVRPGKSEYRVVAVYPSTSAAREQERAFRTEAARDQETIWDHETAVDGRTVTLTAFVPTGALGRSRPRRSGLRQQILNRIDV